MIRKILLILEMLIQQVKVQKNFISNVYTVFWKTTDLIVESATCKKQMKLKPLFDQGLKRSYVTKRAK